MASPINQRDHTQAVIYLEATPTSNGLNEVKAGDMRTDAVNEIVYLRNNEAAWIPVNDWNYIQNRPTTMTPTAHGLNSDRHFGRLPITKISGHTINERVHQQVASIGFLVGLTSGENF